MKIAVILGHRLNNDGSVTQILQKRLDLALQLIVKEQPHRVIVSGGIANPAAKISEAEVMKNKLVECGVDPALIILEPNSLDTHQNAQLSVPIAKSLDATEIVLCTTSEHMYREKLNPVRFFTAELIGSGIELKAFCDTSPPENFNL